MFKAVKYWNVVSCKDVFVLHGSQRRSWIIYSGIERASVKCFVGTLLLYSEYECVWCCPETNIQQSSHAQWRFFYGFQRSKLIISFPNVSVILLTFYFLLALNAEYGLNLWNNVHLQIRSLSNATVFSVNLFRNELERERKALRSVLNI